MQFKHQIFLNYRISVKLPIISMYATIQLVHRTIHTCKMTNIITQISMAGKRWECSGGFSWSGGTAWRGAKNYEGQPFLIYVYIIVNFFILQKLSSYYYFYFAKVEQLLLGFDLKLKTFRWAWQTWQVKLPWDLSSIAKNRRIQCLFNQSGFLDKKKIILKSSICQEGLSGPARDWGL